MSSLSDASVPSTLPSRTETPAERPRTATASAASAPAFLAASTRAATRSTSLEASTLLFMDFPGRARLRRQVSNAASSTIYCSGSLVQWVRAKVAWRRLSWQMLASEAFQYRKIGMAVATPGIYSEMLLLLGGAVVSAPLFKRIGLGTILGYLAAGIAIGPAARLITDGEADPSRCRTWHRLPAVRHRPGAQAVPAWGLRRDIFGLGLAQVRGHRRAACRPGASCWPGWPGRLRSIVGFGLALSSTAFAMQILDQEGATNTTVRPDDFLDPAVPGSRHRSAAGADSAFGARVGGSTARPALPQLAIAIGGHRRACWSPGAICSTRCFASLPIPAPRKR